MARITTFLAVAELIPWLFNVGYAFLALALNRPMPSISAWGPVQALCFLLLEATTGLFYSRSNYLIAAFWIVYTIAYLVELISIIITVDLSWTYYKILYYGGTGWEKKNYRDVLYDYDEDIEYSDEY